MISIYRLGFQWSIPIDVLRPVVYLRLILNKIISFSQLFPRKKLKKEHHTSWFFTKNSLRNWYKYYYFIFVRKVYDFSGQVAHKFQITKSHQTHALHKISSKLWLRSEISLSSLITTTHPQKSIPYQSSFNILNFWAKSSKTRRKCFAWVGHP